MTNPLAEVRFRRILRFAVLMGWIVGTVCGALLPWWGMLLFGVALVIHIVWISRKDSQAAEAAFAEWYNSTIASQPSPNVTTKSV